MCGPYIPARTNNCIPTDKCQGVPECLAVRPNIRQSLYSV